jgi:hypothetical protein
MEDDGDYMEDDNFYPSDYEDDLNELVKVEEFLQGVHERSNTNIRSSIFQETYFLSSNGEMNMDEEEGVEEILESWEDLLMEGVEHINIETPTPHEFSSSSFENISIETFPKYVHFTHQFITLMIDCIRGDIFLHFTKSMKQTLFFDPLKPSWAFHN